jgi:hypothetical protein
MNLESSIYKFSTKSTLNLGGNIPTEIKLVNKENTYENEIASPY